MITYMAPPLLLQLLFLKCELDIEISKFLLK